MPSFKFEQLAADICSAAQVEVPDLRADDNGTLAFNLVMNEVVVNLVHLTAPDVDNDEAFILITFGKLPECNALESLRVLAETNFAVWGAQAPVFGLNPATHEVVVRQSITLSRIDAAAAFGALTRLVGLAREWRANPTMAPIHRNAAQDTSYQLA